MIMQFAELREQLAQNADADVKMKCSVKDGMVTYS